MNSFVSQSVFSLGLEPLPSVGTLFVLTLSTLSLGLSCLFFPRLLQKLSFKFGNFFKDRIGFYPFLEHISSPMYLWTIRAGGIFLLGFSVILAAVALPV